VSRSARRRCRARTRRLTDDQIGLDGGEAADEVAGHDRVVRPARPDDVDRRADVERVDDRPEEEIADPGDREADDVDRRWFSDGSAPLPAVVPTEAAGSDHRPVVTDLGLVG
jgi:hypothetical protein